MCKWMCGLCMEGFPFLLGAWKKLLHFIVAHPVPSIYYFGYLLESHRPRFSSGHRDEMIYLKTELARLCQTVLNSA